MGLTAASRRLFTLLEVLVVLMILSLAAVITGVKVQQIYLEQRFYSEAQQVLGQLALAQDMMLIIDTDVQVILQKDSQTGMVSLKLDTEEPLPGPIAKLVERVLTFSSIKSFSFENANEDRSGSNTNLLVLDFFFGKMSKGLLTLSEEPHFIQQNASSREFIIELLGFPAPIGKPKKKLSSGRYKNVSLHLYPAEVYKELYEHKENEIQTPKTPKS